MTKSTILICAALLTSMITAQAAQSDATQTTKKNANNSDPKCPDVVLRRELPEGQRFDAAMKDDDPIYLSKHYCFVFWEIKGMTKYDFPTKYTFKQTDWLFRRYHRTYDTLRTDEERIVFAHLYIKTLSQKSLVLPKSIGNYKIAYLLPTLVGDEVVMFSSNISTKDYTLIYDGLMALADKPAIDKDWPKLVKLVDLVLTNLDSKVAQTIEEYM